MYSVIEVRALMLNVTRFLKQSRSSSGREFSEGCEVTRLGSVFESINKRLVPDNQDC